MAGPWADDSGALIVVDVPDATALDRMPAADPYFSMFLGPAHCRNAGLGATATRPNQAGWVVLTLPGPDAPDDRRTGTGHRSAAARAEATMNNLTVVLITVMAIMSVVVWFDRRCLADLATTSEQDLRYFNRNTWALIIVLSFPIGPMMYLLYAKGPRRYS